VFSAAERRHSAADASNAGFWISRVDRASFTYLYGSLNNRAVIHKSVQFFEELHGYPKIRAVFGITVRLFKNPSSFSKNRAVVRNSVRLFEELCSCWKFCPVVRRTVQLLEIPFSFSNNRAVV